MTTRVLKFKYSKSNKDKYIADIKFCGSTIENTTISLPAKAIYFTISETDSFMRKFRETRASKFLLN
jgi:hypothetical protein